MDILEKRLADRFQAVAPDIAVPAAEPIEDLRRGARRLRRRRVAIAGGTLAAAVVVTTGIALGTGGTPKAVDAEFAKDPVPTYAVKPEPPTDRPDVRPPAVKAALRQYEAAVDEHLGELGDTPSPQAMSGEAERGHGSLAFTQDPSMLALDWRIGLDGKKVDVALSVWRDDGEPFDGFGDCADGRQCEQLEVTDPEADGAQATYLHGQLYTVVVHTADGLNRSFALVNFLGKSEPAMPWSADQLVELLLDPRLELPTLG